VTAKYIGDGQIMHSKDKDGAKNVQKSEKTYKARGFHNGHKCLRNDY
jgi:hypothetical protein